jgi:hypothetical protein
MKKPTLLLSLALALLLAATGLVAYGTLHIPEPTFKGSLHDLLPPPPPGWTMKEKPIAESAEMKKAVSELLNYDDGIFVDYLGPGGHRLSVYIAYWRPGKMSHRLVAVHTPDVCWVGGGWQKTKAGTTPELSIPVAPSLQPELVASTVIPPGEDRIFTINGTTEHVWFWHLVGNESKAYGTGTAPPWYATFTDLLSKGLKQREEQFFIRLSSNIPMNELYTGPALPAVLASLPWPATR